MFGKGALLVVLGLSMTFAVYQLQLREHRVSSSDDFNLQYTRMLVRETAAGAMNIGINKIWNENWTNGSFTVYTQGCTATCSVSKPGADTVYALAKAWTSVFDETAYQQGGASLLVEDSLRAQLAYVLPLCRYFWISGDEGGTGSSWNQWRDADTTYGPVHTNTVLNITGAPVFHRKVTAYGGITPSPATSACLAKLYGGWEIGMQINLPTDMSALVAAADAGNGGAPNNTKSVYTLITTFDFLSDGRVARTVSGSPTDTVLVSDIAPTGVIRSTVDVNVKGVFNGQLTIYSTDDINIVDDLVYANNPLSDPASDDFLGLVALDNIKITDNAQNTSDVTVQACLFAVFGEIRAQNWSTRAPAGELRITGSMAQNTRGRIGNYDWSTSTLSNGFVRKYRYDTRLASAAPPNFPTVSHLRLLSWWE
ncbi:MAG: hypothetical protein HUU32_10355 [Calditrichaceae bacterium]|nr:hypothetical protein [Calditrichia bacterium]NUQ41784.1 hypothetical protein [Calditrichaceae bacterium]